LRYHNFVSTFYVENFGCRATQADGAALERQFTEHGLARAAALTHADLVILNSCTVTAAADQDARAAIRRVRRQNPSAKIVVTGCYAQRAPEELAALPGVTCVVGNSHKHQLADLALPILTALLTDSRKSDASARNVQPDARANFIPLTALTGNWSLATGNWVFVSDIFAHTELLAAPVFDVAGEASENARTRPNLKVQDGCDNRCSFCIIPFVRGQSRSLPLEQIVDEVNTLVAAGYRELVISGINLGRWGRDLDSRPPASGVRVPEAGSRKPHFENLIHAILSHTSLEKLRISSVEPMDWSDELIELVASSARIAKHAHVPLQSGSDAVLRRMHRKYRPWHYREKIEKIRAAMTTAAIGADVMVGFPGETDAEFEATRRFIEDLPFTYLHVFTYSARPGTPAAAMLNQVPPHVAHERNRTLRDLAEEKKLAFMRTFIGETLQAITLGSPQRLSSRAKLGDSLANRRGAAEIPAVSADPSQHGESERGISGHITPALTDNYLKLRLRGYFAPNRWLSVHIEDVRNGSLIGTMSLT
jgi:threonylcarbamoyladenosine tRNA methylthiotransferase MtaB